MQRTAYDMRISDWSSDVCSSDLAVVATAEPGDAIVFLGSTLHGAGENRSGSVRRGIIVSYCLGWLKPYENQWLAYPPEIARDFSPDLAALAGYADRKSTRLNSSH